MKQYQPTTPSRRQMSVVNYRDFLTASKPAKALTRGGKRSVGRNNQGRITTRHKGGGHKRVLRLIDFTYDKFDIPAKITSVEYDPNRSGFIGLVVYADGEQRYVLLPNSVRPGETFLVSASAPLTPGNRLPLVKIPVGTFIYNIEVKPKGGAKLVRSAGSYAEVLANDAGYTLVKMPSSEVRKIDENAWASIGLVSNLDDKLTT
jgi:large subunit ribosomal protein L2